jgi:hypothetical protein
MHSFTYVWLERLQQQWQGQAYKQTTNLFSLSATYVSFDNETLVQDQDPPRPVKFSVSPKHVFVTKAVKSKIKSANILAILCLFLKVLVKDLNKILLYKWKNLKISYGLRRYSLAFYRFLFQNALPAAAAVPLKTARRRRPTERLLC